MPRKRQARPTRTSNPTPLYYRLESTLRNAIEIGEYSIGVSLPSEREISALYGVSRITVRRAIKTLEREGLLRRVRGRNGGTFVLRRSKGGKKSALGLIDRVSPPTEVSHIKVIAFDFRACEPEFAKTLRVRDGRQIRHIERVMSTADRPIVHVRDYIIERFGRMLKRSDLDHSLVKPLIKSLGMKIENVLEQTGACLADSRMARMLGVKTGSPLLRVTRSFLARDGRCLYLSVLLINSNYQIAVVLPERSMN